MRASRGATRRALDVASRRPGAFRDADENASSTGARRDDTRREYLEPSRRRALADATNRRARGPAHGALAKLREARVASEPSESTRGVGRRAARLLEMGAAEAEEGDASRGVAAGFDRRDADPGFDRRERDATTAASPEAASRRKMDEVLSVAASMARLCDAKDAEIAELRETLAARAAAAEIAARVEKDKAEEGGGAHSDTDALANAAEADARASEAQANAAEAEARASEAQANAAEAEARASEAQANAAEAESRASARVAENARLERDLASARGDLAGVRAALRDAELDVKASADRAAAAAAEAAAASKTSAELLTLRARLAAETEETARERSLRETADGEVSRLTLAVASLESALGGARLQPRRGDLRRRLLRVFLRSRQGVAV